jgi:hypothetical protein
MLKGTKVNLRILERSDLPLLQSWVNDIDFVGEFEPFAQQSLDRMEKDFDGPGETQIFLIEDKGGSELGYIAHFDTKGCRGIGYMLQPCREAQGIRQRGRPDDGGLSLPEPRRRENSG